MVYFLNNLLLTKEDTDVWMQIIVYIVFAVLWVLGTISKNVQKKNQEKSLQKQNRSDHPVSQIKKIPQPVETIFSKFQQTPNSKIAQIKRLQSKIKKIKPPIAATTKEVPTMPAYDQKPKDQKTSHRQQIIADLTTDTDSLKKAIIYHEILGKPVSLRDSI